VVGTQIKKCVRVTSDEPVRDDGLSMKSDGDTANIGSGARREAFAEDAARLAPEKMAR
jgi:hypothetical protein